MVRPAVVTFLDMMLRDREKALSFEEIVIQADSPLLDKTIKETRIKEKTGALVVAVKRAGSDDYDFNPDTETPLKSGEALILIATPHMVKAIEHIAGLS